MSLLSEGLRNSFKIKELRDRLLFTGALLLVVRLGAHITLPGIDYVALQHAGSGNGGTLFDLYDLFVGGAFKNAAVFALGIMPYISASIIIQLLGAVVPFFQKLQQEGEEGRKKIVQYTRVGTIAIAAMQAWGVTVRLNNMSAGMTMPIIPPAIQGIGFTLSTIIFLTAGTVFIMWLGEQITDRGIGNGISLIIFIGIIARFPNSILDEYQMVRSEAHSIVVELIIIAAMVVIVAGVIFVTLGTRRIPVQYAKRVVGRKVYGGVTQYIPMRVNTAGVMPIIFAQSIMFVPNTVLSFFPDSDFAASMSNIFSDRSFLYWGIYGIMIVFFTYFYTAIAFNPKDVADTMRKQGGFIPGIRPGKQTSDFIDNILTKVTLPGSIFLAIIAILPYFMSRIGVTPGFASFFGGTSLLIIVGVALDTLQQVESHLVMHHYEGFMKSGKFRGRSGYG
ncbi:MAG TPA: preprotein translocase subunit SecY [Candidatus Kapabacteria bacterium]|nr:preprotein translocase subunit SecY [Candidatus Kapabacteria bacterium]